MVKNIENTRTVRPTIVEENSEKPLFVEERKENEFHFEVDRNTLVSEDENPFHYAN